ncbi:hypothetical protein RCO48_34565 [Peribacillus frigoritolerans]|nr:hypothetical protein [Peribacillus frigoritolerans]
MLDGDEYVINGEKTWITNASYSRTVTVTAVSGKRFKGQKHHLGIHRANRYPRANDQ